MEAARCAGSIGGSNSGGGGGGSGSGSGSGDTSSGGVSLVTVVVPLMSLSPHIQFQLLRLRQDGSADIRAEAWFWEECGGFGMNDYLSCPDLSDMWVVCKPDIRRGLFA